MQKTVQLTILPSEAAQPELVRQYVAKSVGVHLHEISGYHIQKRSIDGRGRQPRAVLTIRVFIGERFEEEKPVIIRFPDVSHAKRKVIIIGAGPAGLFAALRLIERGIKPVLIDRGKEVRARRRDIAILNRQGLINPDSNYCFGEGGAGTYSDGKLYTRSDKRGDVRRIQHLFVQFGATADILTEAHPHIGTNKLPSIISAMRMQIESSGGIVHYNKKLVDFSINEGIIKIIKTSDGDMLEAAAVILATGHSARDIFQLLEQKKVHIESKPFALGVRIEHPQELIDRIQYHTITRNIHLPPASYRISEQIGGRGVFSFCMCPGGIIAPASTNACELVVNGWSPSKRDNPFANSGMVVSIDNNIALTYLKKEQKKIRFSDGLLLMEFQRAIEEKAFAAGGGKFVAPAQRMTDFVAGTHSGSLPACSYIPGVRESALREVLPDVVYETLRQAFVDFGKRMKGYFTDEALVVAAESRTSSPVRIPRDPHLLHHPEIQNLYPCGEGPGYAGGIMSAAMDGERIASLVADKFS